MAKAQLTTKSGTVITIEGTPDEVAKLISHFEEPQSKPAVRGGADTGGFRDFLAKHRPKGAVEEIPAMLWWAQEHENAESFGERDIVALYRRGAIRPPKHVAQSMRDLASKKYLRLNAVKGKAGHVTLSRIGADFVLHDLMERKAS
jgi:hypothetical protein